MIIRIFVSRTLSWFWYILLLYPFQIGNPPYIARPWRQPDGPPPKPQTLLANGSKVIYTEGRYYKAYCGITIIGGYVSDLLFWSLDGKLFNRSATSSDIIGNTTDGQNLTNVTIELDSMFMIQQHGLRLVCKVNGSAVYVPDTAVILGIVGEYVMN